MVCCHTSKGVSRKGICAHVGVVDHDVEAAESAYGLLDHGLYLFRVGDVSPDHKAFTASLFDLIEHLLGSILVPGVVDDHGGSFRGECERYRFSYSGRRPRDDRHLVLESHADHLFFLVRQHVYEEGRRPGEETGAQPGAVRIEVFAESLLSAQVHDSLSHAGRASRTRSVPSPASETSRC